MLLRILYILKGSVYDMLGYIYKITNKINKKSYVGLTTQNIETRYKQHLYLLENNKHHSTKLQKDFNIYGKENFLFNFNLYEVDNIEELAELEKEEIENSQSYTNGYNMTLGGECGKSTIPEKNKVLIYHLCKNYKGIFHKLSYYFNLDRTTIKSIANSSNLEIKNYDKEEYFQIVKKLDITEYNKTKNYTPPSERKLTNEQCLELLSVIFLEEGYDKTMCEIFNINSKLTDRLKKHLIYKEVIEQFENMDFNEQEKLKENTFIKYNLKSLRAQRQRRGVKNSLSQEQINYILSNKDCKKKSQIAKDLNISADRVSAVCNGKSYKDLVQNYYTALNKSRN